MSGRRELNPLSSPWQGDILPVNYARITTHKATGCKTKTTTVFPLHLEALEKSEVVPVNYARNCQKDIGKV